MTVLMITACKDSASRAECQIYLSIPETPPIFAVKQIYHFLIPKRFVHFFLAKIRPFPKISTTGDRRVLKLSSLKGRSKWAPARVPTSEQAPSAPQKRERPACCLHFDAFRFVFSVFVSKEQDQFHEKVVKPTYKWRRPSC